MVDINKFWIEGLITGKYPRFLEERGADLNQDGRIAELEIFKDYNQNGIIGDRVDYEDYLFLNRDQLEIQIPFFKWASALNNGNPIHQYFYLFSDLHQPPLIESAYLFLGEFSERVDTALGDVIASPQDVTEAYGILRSMVNVLGTSYDILSLANGIRKRQLDCDTSSLAVFAMGYERRRAWPLHLMNAVRSNFVSVRRRMEKSGHVYLRWEGEESRFNIDFGFLNNDDDYYTSRYSWQPPQSVSETPEKLEAFFLELRGAYLWETGHFEEANAAFRRAKDLKGEKSQRSGTPPLPPSNLEKGDSCEETGISPADPEALNEQGTLLAERGCYRAALLAFEDAIDLNPEEEVLHRNRALVLRELGRWDEAVEAYSDAFTLDQDRVSLFLDSARVYVLAGLYDEALTALDSALIEDENLTKKYRNARTFLLEKLGREEEALEEYDKERKSDLKNAAAHFRYGFAAQRLGHYSEALSAYKMALRRDPNDILARYYYSTSRLLSPLP